MDIVADQVIMIDTGSGVDDAALSDPRGTVDDSSGHHRRSEPDLNVGPDHCSRVDQLSQLDAICQKKFLDPLPNDIISDRHKKIRPVLI